MHTCTCDIRFAKNCHNFCPAGEMTTRRRSNDARWPDLAITFSVLFLETHSIVVKVTWPRFDQSTKQLVIDHTTTSNVACWLMEYWAVLFTSSVLFSLKTYFISLYLCKMTTTFKDEITCVFIFKERLLNCCLFVIIFHDFMFQETPAAAAVSREDL